MRVDGNPLVSRKAVSSGDLGSLIPKPQRLRTLFPRKSLRRSICLSLCRNLERCQARCACPGPGTEVACRARPRLPLGPRPGRVLQWRHRRRNAAILTSFITTCRRLQINPFTYLHGLFQRISAHPVNRLDDLLPDNWKAAQHAASNLPA